MIPSSLIFMLVSLCAHPYNENCRCLDRVHNVTVVVVMHNDSIIFDSTAGFCIEFDFLFFYVRTKS